MVYLVTALIVEASPLINKYNLKKDMKLNEFQVFRNNEIALIVTGVGKIKAAMGLVYLMSKYGITKKDIVINIGLCGSSKLPLGTLIIADKITDYDTKRDYYPDVFVSGYMTKSLMCYPYVVNKDEADEKDDVIVDMESSGIMEAAYKFLYSHQIVICKIVSDNLTGERLDILFIQSIINKNLMHIDAIIKQCKEIISSLSIVDLEQEEDYILRITENLRLTEALSDILRSKVRKAKIKGMDVKATIERYMNHTCKTKDERKKIFDELSKALNQEL